MVDPALTDLDIEPMIEASLAVEADTPADDTSSKVGRKSRKKHRIVPGSSADFRRKEANRLAAERSRHRANKKQNALDVASEALEEENRRLKAELAELEGSHPTSVAALPSVDDTDPEAAQHSRTILAALMDGVGDAMEKDPNWIQGVENLIKEADASGRLGELATVASGRQDGPPQAESSSTSKRKRKVGKTVAPRPVEDQSSATTVTVAINGEMEALLQDELAQTKATIVRIEREIAQLRGEPMEQQEDPIEASEMVEAEVLYADVDHLVSRNLQVLAEAEAIKTTLPGLREVAITAQDRRTEEGKRFKAAIDELKSQGDQAGADGVRSKVILQRAEAAWHAIVTDKAVSRDATPFSHLTGRVLRHQ